MSFSLSYFLNINPSQKVPQLDFERWYLSFECIIKVEFGIMKKSFYSPLQWYPIWNVYVIMECAVLLNRGKSKKWNPAKFTVIVNSEFFICVEDGLSSIDVESVMHDCQFYFSLFFGGWIVFWMMFRWSLMKCNIFTPFVWMMKWWFDRLRGPFRDLIIVACLTYFK